MRIRLDSAEKQETSRLDLIRLTRDGIPTAGIAASRFAAIVGKAALGQAEKSCH
jgi:hypothetical protein